MKRQKRTLHGVAMAVATVGLFTSACTGPRVVAPRELPLERVSIYRNGVGYFERSGKIKADRLQFQVRPEHIGDFLATLAVMEKGGSSVRSASFPLRLEDATFAEPPGGDGTGAEPPPRRRLETVVLELDGEEHELAVGYVTEQPVWKPSYRLVLEEDGPMLQAWGIVQNLSGEDWKDVSLSLVAGAPIAFEATLQTPVTPRRPVVNDTGELIGAVPKAQSTIAQRPPAAPLPAPPPPRAQTGAPPPSLKRRESGPPMTRGAPSPGRPMAPQAQAESMAPERDELSIESARPHEYTMADSAPRNVSQLAAQATEGGSTRYDLPHKVTVPKDSATMVLLLAQKVKGESVFMFAPEGGVPDSQRHPFRVVRFTNTTQGLLERGPIAVYEASSFLGQGVMEPLSEGGEATVPFALDRSIALESQRQVSTQSARVSRIEQGSLHIDRDQVVQTKYQVRNGKKEEARVVVQHRRTQGMRLHQPPEGTEDQVGQGLALVPVTVAARGGAELKVDERRAFTGYADWFSAEADEAVKGYLADPRADPKVADGLRLAWAIRGSLQKATEEKAKLDGEQAILEDASEETRENLRAIAKNKSGVDALRKRLADRLNELDNRLGQLSKRLVELDLAINEQRVRFTETVRELKLEAPLPPTA